MKKSMSSPAAHDGIASSDADQAALLKKILREMWSDTRLVEAFLDDKKGWQKDLAESLKVTPAQVKDAMSSIGDKAFKMRLAENPAGISLSVLSQRNKRPILGSAMNTNASQCATGNSCGTCNTYCTCMQTKLVL